MNRILRKTIIFTILAALIMGSLFVYNRHKNALVNNISESFFAFDTYSTITIYEGGSKEALEEMVEICRSYENIFSPTSPESELYKINNCVWSDSEISNNLKEIEISHDLYEAISICLPYTNITSGRYNIASRPLTSLWDFHYSSEPYIPGESQISKALNNIGFEGLDFILLNSDKPVLKLFRPVSFDLGSVAKGYIADRLSEYAGKNNITSAVIDLGGNISCVGSKYVGRGKYTDFQIGIQTPMADSESLSTTVSVSNSSVVTSGTYQRFFEKDGRVYHHILDAVTGYPVDTELAGVSIIGPSSALCDVLSTACFILGEDMSQELLKDCGYSAFFIYNNGVKSYIN